MLWWNTRQREWWVGTWRGCNSKTGWFYSSHYYGRGTWQEWSDRDEDWVPNHAIRITCRGALYEDDDPHDEDYTDDYNDPYDDYADSYGDPYEDEW